jgi:hypothetical protein
MTCGCWAVSGRTETQGEIMLKYVQILMVGCLLCGAVSCAGDNGNGMQGAPDDTDISSKFTELKVKTLYHSGNEIKIKSVTPCYVAGQNKKIDAAFDNCKGSFNSDSIGDCKQLCDKTITPGDTCIGISWNEAAKECVLYRYVIMGSKHDEDTDADWVRYIHKERVTMFDRPADSWYKNKKYPMDESFRANIFAYAYDSDLSDLDKRYFSKINSIYGTFIEINNVDLVKKKKDYYLQCSRGSDGGSFKACKEEFNDLLNYIPQTDRDALQKEEDTLSVKCKECQLSYVGGWVLQYKKMKGVEDPIKRKKILEQLSTKYLFTHRIVDYLEEKYGHTMKDKDDEP